MSAPPADPMRPYLLGRLGEEAQDRLERRLLADADAIDALEAAQDDLIEDYLDGALEPADRAAFEAHFLAAPSHAESLACARLVREALLREAGEAPARPTAGRRGPRPIVVAWLGAAAALVLAAVWLGQGAPERPQVAGSLPPTATVPRGPAVPSSPPPGATEPAAPAARPVRTASATFLVNREMSAAGEATALHLERGVEGVQLEIVLEGASAYRQLAAQLVTAGGAAIEWKDLAPSEIVTLRLAASRLPAGVHTLVLTGRQVRGGPAEELDRWRLSVRKP
jgi:hypothetical protein